MSDLISRQDAIDAVKHAWAKGLEPTQYIEALPSAEPERTVKVKRVSYDETMIYETDGECECGKCVDALWNYCPNCGAKLEWRKR